MQFTPRDYQKLIIDHILKHKRCSIWAGMGLGKTVSTLTALNHLALVDPLNILIVAPLRVARTTWPEELQKWEHLGFTHKVISGTPKERLQKLKIKTDITLINYEQIEWLVGTGLWDFNIVVADESTKLKSHRLRGHGGKRAYALSKVAPLTDRWINLTGTPSPNGLSDLWGQQWFVDFGERLGRTHTSFIDRWFITTDYGVSATAAAQREIEQRLQDVCLSIRTEDYFSTEEPLFTDIKIDLPDKARGLYDQMQKELFIQIREKEIEVFNAAGRINKCLQIANGAVYDENGVWEEIHQEKLDALEEIIEEAPSPVLVAYNFKSDLARLTKRFKKGQVLDKNPATIESWNKGKIPVLFAHPQSCGHGLNLQYGGNVLAFFGLTWNLEYYQQTIERIGPARQKQAGFDRCVYVYHIAAKNTVDNVVLAALKKKAKVQDVLLESVAKNSLPEI